ncbi:hypothetical protein [Streptomyces nitrosporeus]|uniref:hypothetical protein n=1 Tax=Streptomyces nitrosporeus TaxID=28894 RepID=UPI00399F0B3D
MPSYHEVMSTDLSALVTAADAWDALAGGLSATQDTYRSEVYDITLGPAWVGESADAARRLFGATLQEYATFRAQAEGVAVLLRDAHAQLVPLRSAVEAAAREAVAAGMAVSGQGRCRLDFGRLPEAQRTAALHDPGLPAVEQSWTDHITRAVEAVTTADTAFAAAVKGATATAGPAGA